MELPHSHSICVVSHDNYASLYGKVNAYLSKGYAVVYAVEELAVTDTIQKMNDAGVRTTNYVDNNALTILDRNSVYSQDRTKLEGRLLLETWKEIISEVNQKGNFKGIAAMGMPEPFFETTNHQKLVEYEQLVSKEFDGSIEAVCCYTQKSVTDLSLRHLVSLLNSHQYTVANVKENNEWHPTDLLEMIAKGLEKTMGKTTSKLALEAIKAMYKIDEKTLISQLEVFERGIKRTLADSAETIFDAIKSEIITSISFNQAHLQSRQGVEQVSAGPNFLICRSCHWSATAIGNWRPVICPVCHNNAVRSLPMNYPDADKR